MNKQVLITETPEQTQQFAQTFASSLEETNVICLYGNLGSGKTTFVQGFAKGLGINKRMISPTFVIVRTYKIEFQTQDTRFNNFYHIDLYRIENQKDIEGLGIKEIISDPQNIVLIEWAERMGSFLPKDRIDINFEYIDENRRKITIQKSRISV